MSIRFSFKKLYVLERRQTFSTFIKIILVKNIFFLTFKMQKGHNILYLIVELYSSTPDVLCSRYTFWKVMRINCFYNNRYVRKLYFNNNHKLYKYNNIFNLSSFLSLFIPFPFKRETLTLMTCRLDYILTY